MFATPEFNRRMASLQRAEAGRSGVPVRSPLAKVALARRLSARAPERPGAVDPVMASVPDRQPLFFGS